MELKDVVMIAGQPGLYKVIGQRKNGLVVEALDGSEKKLATSPSQKISVLADIAIFTQDEEVRLSEVLLEIKKQTEAGLLVPDKKAGDDEFRNFLGAVVPNFDRERVYTSDIKKLVSWWSFLNDKLDFEKLTVKEEESADENATDAKVDKKAGAKVPKVKNLSTTPKANTKGKGAKSVSTPRKTQ